MPRDAAAQWVILHGKSGHTAWHIPAEIVETLKDLARKKAQFNSIALAPNGGWAILHDKNAVVAKRVPTEAAKLFADLQAKAAPMKFMAFTYAGGWSILTGDGSFSRDIGEEPFQKLMSLGEKGRVLKSISFAPNGGWVILFDKNSHFAKDAPEDFHEKLVELVKKNVTLQSIAFAPNGGWAILYNKNSVASKNLPPEADQALTDLARKGTPLKSITFMTRSFLSLSADDKESHAEVLLRMNRSDVPGMAIALVDKGKVEWARGYGVLRAKEETPVTDRTHFQAGSISQFVTALGVLRLVQQKKLVLDQDLNARLMTWKIPENEFTRQKQPTLRQALSHTAGFNLSTAVFPPGASLSLLEMLDGEGNTPAIRIEQTPGSKFQASAGGYCVIHQLLNDVSGKPFRELMQDLILRPVAMKDSTFEQPLPHDWEADAAVGHFVDQQPLAWRWDNCTPALAAAGLWSTPADLGRLVVAIAQAHQGKGKSILDAAQIKALLTRQIDDRGLAVGLTGKDQSLSYSLRGLNTGYVCYLIGYPATGQGAVLMTNSDSGERLISDLVDNLRLEYGWPE